MSVLKRLAAWLDPEAAVAREESKNAILNAQDAINEMSTKIVELSKANDNLIDAAAIAGLKAKTRGEAVKKLVTELAVARSYIIDVVDEIDDQLAGLSERSKKRPVLEATRAVVRDDIGRINQLIDSAKLLGLA